MTNRLTSSPVTHSAIFTDNRLEEILRQRRERTDRATEQAVNAVAQVAARVQAHAAREAALRQQINEETNTPLPQPTFNVTVDVSAIAENPQRLHEVAEQFLFGRGRQTNLHQALRLLEMSAKLNYAPALFRLGEIYRQGQNGISPNIYQAVYYYRKAAELQHLGAMVQLYRAAPVKDTFEGALWCGRADHLNLAEAMADFRIRYPSASAIDVLAARHFQEAKKFQEDAVRCYREAGAAGHGLSYNKLGDFYSNGRIVPPTGQTKQEAALESYHNAVSKNTFPPITSFTNQLLTTTDCHQHGDLLRAPYPAAAFACYQKANDCDGYCKMAVMYTRGHGVSRNIQSAFECYEIAHSKLMTSHFAVQICALSDDPHILMGFGDRSGDPKVKFACYEKAQCNKKLGDCYAQGIGINVDREKAFEQYNLAALDTDILFGLIQALLPSSGEYISWGDRCRNRPCAIKCYTQANAHLKLAEAYRRGDGVPQNPWQAFTFCMDFLAASSSHRLTIQAITDLTNDRDTLWRMGLEAENRGQPLIADGCFQKGAWGVRLLQESRNSSLSLDLRCTRYLQAYKCGEHNLDALNNLTSLMTVARLIQFKNQAALVRFQATAVVSACQEKITSLNQAAAAAARRRSKKRRRRHCTIS